MDDYWESPTCEGIATLTSQDQFLAEPKTVGNKVDAIELHASKFANPVRCFWDGILDQAPCTFTKDFIVAKAA